MRRSLPGINYELAAAVRRINSFYLPLPESVRPDVTGERWDLLEAELDRTCGAGDRDGALRAIRAWEEHTRRVIAAARAAALEVRA